MLFDEFEQIADEVVAVGSTEYKAVINRTTTRYRDLLPLLTRNEKLAEVFVHKYPVVIGETFETDTETFRVVEVREAIDGQVSHCLCVMKTNPILRDGNKYK